MRSLADKVIRFLLAEDGPTAVEYAMMLLLIFLACISVITILGQQTSTSLQTSGGEIQEAFTSP